MKQNKYSGASRTFASLEIDFFVIIVCSYKPVTISIENSVLDDLGVLAPPLITSSLLMTSNKVIFCRVFKYKTISLENGSKFETSQENLFLNQKSQSLSSTCQFAYIYIYIYIYSLLEASKRDWARINMRTEHETTFKTS